MVNFWNAVRPHHYQQPGHYEEHDRLAAFLAGLCNIEDYGAHPEAIDNTASIQDAMNDAAILKSEIYIPPFTYRYLHQLVTPPGMAGINCRGALNYRGNDPWAMVIGDAHYDDDNTPLATQRMYIHRLNLDGTGSQGSGGVLWRGMARSAAFMPQVGHFAGVGIQTEYSWINAFYQPIITDCSVAMRAYATSRYGFDQAFNGNLIQGGELGAGCNYGVIVGDETATEQPTPTTGTGFHMIGVTVEGTKKIGVWVVDGIGINIDHCYFERNGYISNPVYPLDYVRCSVRLGSDYIRPTAVHLAFNTFSGNINSHPDDPAAAIRIDRVWDAFIGWNACTAGIAGRGLRGIQLVSNRAERVSLWFNYFNGATEFPFESGNATSYELRDYGIP